MDDQTSTPLIVKIIRHVARFSSLIVFIGVGLVITGSYNFPELRKTPLPNEYMFQISLLISVAGLILAWRWELWGGIVNVGFYLVSLFVYWRVFDRFMVFRGVLGIGMIIVPGLLFILCWRLSRPAKQNTE